MKIKRQVIVILLLVFALIAANYNFLDTELGKFLDNSQYVKVTRIVDGDTIKTENETIRLLGINTPERGELYYQEAKDFLQKFILNKSVKLEFEKDIKDRYNRTLAYIFLGDKNVNKEIVNEGYANCYFPSGKDEHYLEFKDAWEECIKENKNYCEKSEDKCADCIEIEELNVEKQRVIFYNKCEFSCNLKDWTIKDEGRKKFVFPEFILKEKKEVSLIVGNNTNTDNILYWVRKDYVWTKTGDTLFLRDENGGLVEWKNY